MEKDEIRKYTKMKSAEVGNWLDSDEKETEGSKMTLGFFFS